MSRYNIAVPDGGHRGLDGRRHYLDDSTVYHLEVSVRMSQTTVDDLLSLIRKRIYVSFFSILS